MNKQTKCPQCGGHECGVSEVETEANYQPKNDNGADVQPSNPAKLLPKADRNCSQTATLITQLKQRGHNVSRTSIGGFNVSQWGMMTHCIDTESLKAFAKKVGAI